MFADTETDTHTMGHCRIRLRDINGNAVGSANTGGTTPIAVMSANTTSNVWFGLRLSEKGVQPEQWNLGLCTWAPGDPVPVGKTCDSCIPVRLLEDGSNRLVPDPSGTPIVWNIIQATATKPGAENVIIQNSDGGGYLNVASEAGRASVGTPVTVSTATPTVWMVERATNEFKIAGCTVQ